MSNVSFLGEMLELSADPERNRVVHHTNQTKRICYFMDRLGTNRSIIFVNKTSQLVSFVFVLTADVQFPGWSGVSGEALTKKKDTKRKISGHDAAWDQKGQTFLFVLIGAVKIRFLS